MREDEVTAREGMTSVDVEITSARVAPQWSRDAPAVGRLLQMPVFRKSGARLIGCSGARAAGAVQDRICLMVSTTFCAVQT